MDMKRAIDHLPISSSSSDEPPTPIPCHICGKDQEMISIEFPGIGKRWVPNACECKLKQREEWEQYQRQFEKNQKIRDILKLSSSMEQLQHFTFDNLVIRPGMENAYKEIQEAVEQFDQREKIGVFIFGESGNGKTHLTSSGANELMKRGYSVIFLTEKDLLTRFSESDHFSNQERFSEIMNACLQADLLVWDDFLSSQSLNRKEKDWIFQIVNGRERAKKPIWYTSNITPAEFSRGKYEFVLDDKGRTWWRIVGNNVCIWNRASNYRKVQAMNRMNSSSQDTHEDERL